MLPFPVIYEPYTFFHVLGMLELLLFGALAFTILILSGFYPPELRAVNLDADWFFRMPGRMFIRFCHGPLKGVAGAVESVVRKFTAGILSSPGKVARIETEFDKFFHQVLTTSPFAALRGLIPMNTESRKLSWNLLYILIPFILFLILVLGG